MRRLKKLLADRHYYLTILIVIGLILTIPHCGGSQAGWDQVPKILEKINPPQFADNEFNIRKYGAVGNGEVMCTAAFKEAIDACHQAGGGKVIVPEGVYLTGAIQLKDNVNLHVAQNAKILFSQDPQDYLPMVFTRFEGMECMNYSPFIYAFGKKNIAITGQGILDGNADRDHWWPWKGRKEYGWEEGDPNSNQAKEKLRQMVADGVPVEDRKFGEGSCLRPNFIQLYKSKNILIKDITLHNSPMWQIHPVLSENITVKNVNIESHGPNNDGINPESCTNVLIKDSYFDTGDDCIAIKSGRNRDGRRIGVPSKNIVVQDCRMKDGHGGVVMGSEMSGGIENVYAEDSKMDSPNLERVLRIKTNSLRGGYVRNVYFRNIEVGEVSDAVVRINFRYGIYADPEKGDYLPTVENINVDNINSEKSTYGLYLIGYEKSPIKNIKIKNSKFNGVEQGNKIQHVENLHTENFYINGELQSNLIE